MPRAINPEGVLYLITSAIKIYKVAISICNSMGCRSIWN